MSGVSEAVGWGRNAAAAALSGAMLAGGAALVAVSEPARHSTAVPLALLVAVLLPIYVLAHRYTLDFEFRRVANSVTMVQLPLALGVLLVAPLAHLVVRLGAAVLNVTTKRHRPQQALYNLGVAALEVGAAAFAVGLVPAGETGPPLWLALYTGLLLGDLIGAFVLAGVWKLVGVPVDFRSTIWTFAATAPVALLFTGLAAVAISAATVEASTTLVMLALAAWLGLAYRAHRRLRAQHTTTEQLYTFVKDLGPLSAGEERAPAVLEQVRRCCTPSGWT